MKAADPDNESKPINIAGFRNCGDDVPSSFAINANNAISLPTALQRHLPCHAPARTPHRPESHHESCGGTRRIDRSVRHDVVTGVLFRSRIARDSSDDSDLRGFEDLAHGAFIGGPIRRLDFKHGTWRIKNRSRCKQPRIQNHACDSSGVANGQRTPRLGLNHSKL